VSIYLSKAWTVSRSPGPLAVQAVCRKFKLRMSLKIFLMKKFFVPRSCIGPHWAGFGNCLFE
jgi:hypothetical protein